MNNECSVIQKLERNGIPRTCSMDALLKDVFVFTL